MTIETASLFEDLPRWEDRWGARPITRYTSDRWLTRYHYLGPAGVGSHYGVFAGDLLAVVVIGPEGGGVNTAGVAGRLGLEAWPENREITRVAVHPDAAKNTASRSIALVCALVAAAGWEWLFSYADVGQDHHGGIYQALNGIYVGVVDARPGYLVDGRQVHPRQMVSMYGTHSRDGLAQISRERGVVIERVDGLITPKLCYVLPIGSPASRREIRRHLAPRALPYLKRETLPRVD